MNKMIVKQNEPIEFVLKKFKLFINKTGIIKSVQNKLYYIKPTWKKRLKKLNKIKKIQKQIRINNSNKNLF